MKRTFLALPVETTSSFLIMYEKIRNELAGESIKWVPPDRLHITMFFFGATSDDMEFRIKKALATMQGASIDFRVVFDHLGVFPSKKNARVLWAGVENPKPFQHLYESLTIALEQGDAALERNHAFTPHLTLGRPKWIRDRSRFMQILESHQSIHLLSTRIDRLVYYQSILTPDGPLYKPLGIYPPKPV
jgi:2'-5' RNA ligase